jgi:hypothetical protein
MKQRVANPQHRRMKNGSRQGTQHTCRRSKESALPPPAASFTPGIQQHSHGHLQRKSTEIIDQYVKTPLFSREKSAEHSQSTDSVHKKMQDRIKNRHANAFLPHRELIPVHPFSPHSPLLISHI